MQKKTCDNFEIDPAW